MTPETAAKYGLPFDDLTGVRIPPEALERLPAADARRLGVAPLWARGNVLAVATSRPDDFELSRGSACSAEARSSSWSAPPARSKSC